MPNYPSSFINGVAPGVRAVNNVTDARELKFVQALSVAFVAAGTVGTPATIHAATTANITLSNSQTVDGVSLTAAGNNTVLVKDQTNPAQNGLYTVVDAGAWTRVTAFDTSSEWIAASNFRLPAVAGGTVNSGRVFVVRNVFNGFTLATDPLRFEQLPVVNIFNSAAKYPTDSVVGTATRVNPSHIWEDFVNITGQLDAALLLFEAEYASTLSANSDELAANSVILTVENLQRKFEMNLFELNRLTADLTRIRTASGTLRGATSKYPSGQNRGY
jgi:hypothetical protein